MSDAAEHRGRNEVPAPQSGAKLARKAKAPIVPNGYTPGPWKARGYANDEGGIWIDCDSWKNPKTASCRGGTLATAHKNGAGEGTVEGNAKLIAAAPEMLAALQCVENLMTELGAKGEPLKTVRAAIAKATGAS